MVQAIIKFDDHQDRVLTIIKGKYGLKTKSDAVGFVINKFEKELLDPQLRPEYLEELNEIKKSKGKSFKNINDLRKHIENV